MWIYFYLAVLTVCFTQHTLACKTTCVRAPGWCRHAGATYDLLDCDSDGVLDPVCSDTNAAFGYIKLGDGCRGIWPGAHCYDKKGRVCNRIKGWCRHGGATYLYQDCDGDGIPDPVCSDTNGSFGIIKSSQNCAQEWPNARCRAKGAGYTCRRHSGWCRHGGATYMLLDCDNDGTPDPVCSDTNGALGVIGSATGCHSVWPKAECRHKNTKVCARPKGWCRHAGAKFMFKDCDGDGIPDPVCSDTNGSLGVIKSSKGCKDGWPHDSCRKA